MCSAQPGRLGRIVCLRGANELMIIRRLTVWILDLETEHGWDVKGRSDPVMPMPGEGT